MTTLGPSFALLLASALLFAAPAPSRSDMAPELQTLLTRDLKFSAGDLADLQHGKVVKRAVDTSAAGEVAVVGAVRVNAPKEKLVEAYRDIAHFKRGPDVLEIGVFSDPPVEADLDGLTIGPDDLNLRDCRVRDCDIRLPAAAIERVQHEIDWRAPDADHRAAALFKRLLLDDVRAYVSGSPGRITEYDDDKRTVRPNDDFAAILAASPYVGALVPGLDEHLRDFAGHPLAGAEDLIYWSKEKFGLTPFITVTQVTIAHDAEGDAVLASRDVYSSRYVDASLTLTVAGDTAASPRAFYLVYVNRSRANALKGLFAGLRQAIVVRRAKSSLDENLKSIKARLEERSGRAGGAEWQ
jgi:hypothetical protein